MPGTHVVPEGVGGGVAPGRRGRSPNKAQVRFVPMWSAWDAGGVGSWRLVPKDRTHKCEVREDELGDTQPYYEWKGFVPMKEAPPEAIPGLVEMAVAARKHAASLQLPEPDWVPQVFDEHGEPSAKAKA